MAGKVCVFPPVLLGPRVWHSYKSLTLSDFSTPPDHFCQGARGSSIATFSGNRSPSLIFPLRPLLPANTCSAAWWVAALSRPLAVQAPGFGAVNACCLLASVPVRSFAHRPGLCPTTQAYFPQTAVSPHACVQHFPWPQSPRRRVGTCVVGSQPCTLCCQPLPAAGAPSPPFSSALGVPHGFRDSEWSARPSPARPAPIALRLASQHLASSVHFGAVALADLKWTPFWVPSHAEARPQAACPSGPAVCC